MAHLVFLRDARQVRLQLTNAAVAIGRVTDADVRLLEGDVSRRHARVFRRDDAWWLQDMESTGGSFVNGKRVLPDQPVILGHGDNIRIGSNTLVFENDEEIPPGQPKKRPAGIEICDDSESSIQKLALTSGYGVLTVRPEEKLKGILKINEALAGNVDFRAICPRVLDTLFDIFPQADRGAILFLQDGSVLVPVAQRHRNIDDCDSVRISRAILNNVLKENSAILSTNTAMDSRLGDSDSVLTETILSAMCIPMLSMDGKPFGIINLDSRNPRQRFTDEDLQLLLAVANQAAHAFESARLLTSHMEKLRQDDEMKISAQVQRALIPEVLPQPQGYQFYGSYDTAQAVGGDYFDCFEMPEEKICVSFGDVSGKGVPAALIMSRLSGIVRNTMNFTNDVGIAMCQINSLICSNMIDGRFVTYILGVVDLKTHTFIYANAGHMPPEIRSPEGELSSQGIKRSGLPIGIDRNFRFETSTVPLAAGTSVILRTDGVDEAMAASGDLYGIQRFREVLRRRPADPATLGRALLADVRAFTAGHTQHDDITIMSFGRLPPLRPGEAYPSLGRTTPPRPRQPS